MKIACLYLLLFLLPHFSVQAQTDSFTLVRSFKGDIAAAAIDNLDNLYIISSIGQIRKYNNAGDSMGVYNQVRNFGALTSIDVSNPLKLVLFYKEFSTIAVLDRYLAMRSSIDLKKAGILQPTAAGLSYDNNFWVFDEYDSKLKKIDEHGETLLSTPDFRTIFNASISPQKIVNDNGFVYLADTASGIFVFDNYGSYKKTLPLKNWKSLEISNSHIISTDAERITVYNPGTFVQRQKKIPPFTPYLHAFTGNNKFITFSSGTLSIYQIPKDF